ncbi:MAG TPA: glycosyltransferase, partial [Hellea balneolensis]|nr:glycosyltransferase [Hellea balneolensis]
QGAINTGGLHIPFNIFKSLIKDYKKNYKFQALQARYGQHNTLVEGGIQTLSIKKHQVEKFETEISSLKGGIKERDKRIRSLVDEEGTLKGGIKERDKRIRKLVDAEGTLKGGIRERDKQIRKLVDAEGTLKGGIRERDKQIRKLVDAVGTLKGGIKERDKRIHELINVEGALKGGIRERDEKIRAITAKAEMDATKAALDIARLQSIEHRQDTLIREFSAQIDTLSMQLQHHKSKPVRIALKAVIFRSLRLAKRITPLPAPLKMKISRRLTGLAQRLQGPATPALLLQENTGPLPIEDTTIDFAFPVTDNPVISIIIPVYNEISQTIACLKSVHSQICSVDFEVIVADDASPDPFHSVLNKIDGVRVFRNPENLGFLQNCNTNAKHARGEYIVFLNNDTLVNPGWLEALYQTFKTEKNVGVVGSKLLFPDGRLQEAGGIIWEDASGWNWGRGDNPDHPKYNYLRDVDYVSGASFMVKKDVFEQTGGFSDTLEKAYYEDTDYCFRMRDMGLRVLYQPLSSLVHIEGLSSGTDVTSGAKKYQEINKQNFYETWKHVLANHLPNGQTPMRAADRTIKGHILYIDATTPEVSSDSGSVDAFNAMRILTGLGYRVHFAPGTNFAFWGEHTKALQAIGIECLHHPFYPNLDSFIKERGDIFDFAVLARAEVNDLFAKFIRKKLKRAKIINYTVDLHFLRMEREADLSGDDRAHQAAETMKAKELSFMRNSDATIVLSEYEYEYLQAYKDLSGKVFTIPLIREPGHPGPGYEARKDIVFIGGYMHPPNVDAVDWLVQEIWPKMSESLPGVNLLICGSHMPERFHDYGGDTVKILGRIEDVDTLMQNCRLSIAPLRFGAGLKGKVASSIGAGAPCIGTQIAFEGMAKPGLEDIAFIAETPEDFAKQAKSLYFDKSKWETASTAGIKYHNENYALASVRKLFETMLEKMSRS